jgi:phage terminase small subunit
MHDPLSYQQQEFVFHYLAEWNASKAAVLAGYSEHSAPQIGSHLLSQPKIQQAIADAAEGRLQRLKVDADHVLRGLLDVEAMDVADILNEDGTVKPISRWPKVWRTNVDFLEIKELTEQGRRVGVLKKIKGPSKLRNRQDLGRHCRVAAFQDRLDLSSSDGTMSPKEATLSREEALALLKSNGLAP